MNTLPQIDTRFPGASCLLCLAAASIANSELTTYTKSLAYEDFTQLSEQIATFLRKKSVDVTIIQNVNLSSLPEYETKELNFAKKDFSSLKNKYHINKLIVIDIAAVGVERSYSAYIPTSDPRAVLTGTGYMVNLDSNALEWYLPLRIQKSSDGAWDEPPKYPGLTNAYFQVLESTKDRILSELNH